MNPYIGITDFTKFEQVKEMLKIFNTHRLPNSKRRLHVGVMMSHKTLNGIETKWSKVFPRAETIADIFYSGETMNCLHYADYSRDDQFLWRDLSSAINWFGIGGNAIQLDMVWPNPDQIRDGIRFSRKPPEVILQVGDASLEAIKDDPQRLVQKLREYGNNISRVLLDRSMGHGLEMNASRLLVFIRAIKKDLPWLGIGVAGGLGPDTLHLLEPIVKEFPDISIDAQGRLRPSHSTYDPVDWKMAGEYLVKAIRMLG